MSNGLVCRPISRAAATVLTLFTGGWGQQGGYWNQGSGQGGWGQQQSWSQQGYGGQGSGSQGWYGYVDLLPLTRRLYLRDSVSQLKATAALARSGDGDLSITEWFGLVSEFCSNV